MADVSMGTTSPLPHTGEVRSTHWRADLIWCGSALVFAWSVLRGLRPMIPYAMGQWLHTYEQGFVKRGLPGAILRPFFELKDPAELRVVLQTAGAAVLLATAIAFVWSARRLLNESQRRGQLMPTAVAVLVLAASPAVVVGAHFQGYFEQWVIPAAAIALVCALRGRWLLAGLICGTSVLAHEAALLLGTPMLCFAAVVSPMPAGAHRLLRRTGRVLATGGPALVVAVVVIIFAGAKTPEALEAFRDGLRETKVITEEWVNTSTYHLEAGRSVLQELSHGWGPGWYRINRDGVFAAAIPPLALLLLVASLELLRRRRGGLVPLLWLCSLSPLVMSWVAWDTGRFTSFAIVNAYLGVFVALFFSGEGSPARWPRVVGWLAVPLGVATVAYSLVTPAWAVNHVVPDGAFDVRAPPAPPSDYRCERPLFPNSNFEAGSFDGWSGKGTAFGKAPLGLDPVRHREAPGKEGSFWVASDRRTAGKRLLRVGDKRVGTLTSKEFVIDGDSMNFLVSGGKKTEKVYVAMRVDGKELYRAAGQDKDAMQTVTWDVAGHRGKRAQIVIADAAKGGWGHINADGFCYR